MLPLQSYTTIGPENQGTLRLTALSLLPLSKLTFWEHVLTNLVTSPHVHYGLLRLLCEDLISGHILTEVTFTVLFSSTQAWKFILKTHVIKLISKTPFPKNVFETTTSHVLNIHSGPGCFLCSYLLPFTLPSNHKLQKGNKRHREVQQFARAACL